MSDKLKALLAASVALGTVAVCLAAPAWANPPDPSTAPPQVQAILAKMKAGQQVTPNDMQTIQSWQNQALGEAAGEGDGGLMGPDIQTLINQMRQGIAPSPADLAKLKAWGARAKPHKQDMLNAYRQMAQTLRAAEPAGGSHPRGTLSDNLLHGQFKLSIDQTVTHTGKDGSDHSHNVTNLTLPVAYKLETDMNPGGRFKLSLLADGQGVPSGSTNWDFGGQGSCSNTNGSGSATVSGWGKYYHLNTKLASVNPALAVFSRPKKAARAYLFQLDLPVDGQGTVNTTTHYTCKPNPHTENGSGTFPARPSVGVTLDSFITGVEGAPMGPATMQSLAQYGVPANPFAQSPEITDALKNLTFNFDADAFVKKFATGDFTATATYSYTMKTKDSDGKGQGQIVSNSTLTLTTEGRQLQAVLMPVDSDVYNKWVPEGPVVPGDGKNFPSKIHFQVQIQNKANQQPVTDLQFKVKYSLVRVSTQPGFCMNYPAVPSPDPDLVFLADNQPDSATVGDDGATLSVPQEHSSEPVEVTSRDYGSWGELQAQVTLAGGAGDLAAIYKSGSETLQAMRIPRDDDENHIADQWEKDKGIYDQKYGADWDGDDNQSQLSKGDGFTLYEEYRGFVTNDTGSPTWSRFDPKTRDLFVYLEDGVAPTTVQRGVDQFAQIVGVTVHKVPDDTYLKYYPGGDGVRTWADFNEVQNSTEGGPGQCAIRFHEDLANGAPATSIPISSVDEASSRTSPCQTKWIAMNPSASLGMILFWKTLFPPSTPLAKVSPSFVAAQQKLAGQGINIDFSTIRATVQSKLAEMDRNLTGFIVIHELGHSAGARHHFTDAAISAQEDVFGNVKAAGFDPDTPEGQKEMNAYYGTITGQTFANGAADCPMRYWQMPPNFDTMLLFISGVWNPLANAPPPATNWTFCNLHDSELHLHK